MYSGVEGVLKPFNYLIPVTVEGTEVHFIVTEGYLVNNLWHSF